MFRQLKRVAAGHLRSWHTTAATLLMVGLAAAAMSTAIAVIQVVLLNPLQVRRPDSLVALQNALPSMSGKVPDPREFLDYAPALHGFNSLAAYSDQEGGASFTAGGRTFFAHGAETTHAFFSTLGIALEKGRGFLPSEQAPGHNRVVAAAIDPSAGAGRGVRACPGGRAGAAGGRGVPGGGVPVLPDLAAG